MKMKTADLVTSLDAALWAKEFIKQCNDINHSTMVAWFANAIMAGYDQARWNFVKTNENIVYPSIQVFDRSIPVNIFDADQYASLFCKNVNLDLITEELMLNWFGNAILTGFHSLN